jgi:hypothetical protein
MTMVNLPDGQPRPVVRCGNCSHKASVYVNDYPLCVGCWNEREFSHGGKRVGGNRERAGSTEPRAVPRPLE